jgi:hypothetical protein
VLPGVEAADAADAAQGPAVLEVRDEERRRRAQCRLSPQLRQLKAEGMFLRRRPRLGPTTIRNCWFTLFSLKHGERSLQNTRLYLRNAVLRKLILTLIASLSLSSCHKTAAPEFSPYTRVELSGISLRFSPNDLGAPSVTQQPRLTAEENGTDIPIDVGPARRVVSFGDKSAQSPRSYISFIPLDDKSVVNYAKSYPQVYGTATELRRILQDRPTEFKPGSQLPDLSSIDEEQEMHCKVRYVDLPLFSGIAFLAQYTQEEHGDPVNNQELYFVFQGLTKDGRYYIDARFAITHPSLPKDVDGTNNIARDKDDQYLRKAERDLDALPDESFKPSIVSLKQLLESVSIAPN